MTTKRTHGPCTCGQKHSDPSVYCAPECASFYPATQEPDALTRLVRWVRAQEGHIVSDEAMFEALSLISEVREEQRMAVVHAENNGLERARKMASFEGFDNIASLLEAAKKGQP